MKFNYEQLEEELQELLAQDIITSFYELTKGQYRINDELDIFPKSQRYFYVSTKERGSYGNLEDFLYNNLG